MTKVRSFRFEENLLEKLEKIAEEECRSVNAQLEYIIKQYLKQKEIAQEK